MKGLIRAELLKDWLTPLSRQKLSNRHLEHSNGERSSYKLPLLWQHKQAQKSSLLEIKVSVEGEKKMLGARLKGELLSRDGDLLHAILSIVSVLNHGRGPKGMGDA